MTIQEKIQSKHPFITKDMWATSYLAETPRGTRRYFIIGEVIGDDESHVTEVLKTAYQMLFNKIPDNLDLGIFILKGYDHYIQINNGFYTLRTIIDCA
jgi:hypothetical protein